MLQKKDTALDIVYQFIDALNKLGVKIKYAYLYGSYAKGVAKADSDIDVAVISEDFSGDRLKDRKLIRKACWDIDWRIEAIPFRAERFRDENPLVWEIKRTGIKIV